MPQMITFREKQSSTGTSKDIGDSESFIVPSSSLGPDASTHRWCVEGMEAINLKGMLPNELGKSTHSIYEDPRVVGDGLSYVPGLTDTMIRYGLKWLMEVLE